MALNSEPVKQKNNPTFKAKLISFEMIKIG